MKYEFQLNPIGLGDIWTVDWHRNGASSGSDNSEREIGLDMQWAFKIRCCTMITTQIGSPGTVTYSDNNHICII